MPKIPWETLDEKTKERILKDNPELQEIQDEEDEAFESLMQEHQTKATYIPPPQYQLIYVNRPHVAPWKAIGLFVFIIYMFGMLLRLGII